MATTDYQSIINDAAEKLEARFSEIQNELAPLRNEEQEIAEAIKRIVGSYPSGYSRAAQAPRGTSASASRAPRTTMNEQDREGAVLEYVNANPEGVTATAVAQALGVSSATATKSVNALLESGAIRSEGERRGRRLLPS